MFIEELRDRLPDRDREIFLDVAALGETLEVRQIGAVSYSLNLGSGD